MSITRLHFIGCGYIGKKVLKLQERSAKQLYAYVNSEVSLGECNQLGAKSLRFNLDKPDCDLSAAVFETMSDGIIGYFVAPPPKGRKDERMAHFINGIKALEHVPRKIVLISTTGVYGDCQGEWIDEMRPLNPQADRAFRRVDAERQLLDFCEANSVDCIILRVPGIYANDKLPIARITSGEPVVRSEDSGFTNRIHADDLACFVSEAMMSNVCSGIYNCCDGHPSTMHDYFMRVADAMHLQRPEEISLQQAKNELSAGMLSYLAESKRISNAKLLAHFETQLKYPDLASGMVALKQT